MVWTSQLQRTESTASFVNATESKRFSSLNEIDAGRFDGLSYEDIEELYPEEFEKRLEDKLGYRYPGGTKRYLKWDSFIFLILINCVLFHCQSSNNTTILQESPT